jgi:hypothetical protein
MQREKKVMRAYQKELGLTFAVYAVLLLGAMRFGSLLNR